MTMMHQFHKKNGDDAYRKEDYQNAIFHYTLAIETARSELHDEQIPEKKKHELASLFSNRAAASTKMSHFHEALHDCDCAIEVDSLYDKAHLRKAQLLTMHGMLDEAIEACQEILSLDSNNKQAQEELQVITTIQTKYNKANDLLQRLYTPDNNISRDSVLVVANNIEWIAKKCVAWTDIQVLQAQVLWSLGHSQQALELTDKLLKQEGTTELSSRLHNLRATIFIAMGDSEQAIGHLRTVLAHERDNERAVKLYAQLRTFLESKAVADQHYKSKKYDDALVQYEIAMKLSPSPNYLAKLHFNRACTHASLGRHDLSIADCNESIRLNPEYIKAYMRRAASLRELPMDREARYESAIEDYKVAMQLSKTKRQSREIKLKLRETKWGLAELLKKNNVQKMQRRNTTPMMVSPDCSPSLSYLRKSAPQLQMSKSNDASEVTMSPRSRTSSASSWNAMNHPRSRTSSASSWNALDIGA
jgi:tetratricopeptide (TPR) repeat protein